MAFSLKELAENPRLIDAVRAPKPKCAECGSEAIVAGQCEDCMYDALGKLVEEHPIPSGRVRR